MIKVKGTDIFIVRGDAATINLTIKDKVAKNNYALDEKDKVTLSVKKDIYCKDILIQKDFENNTLWLEKEDTQNLDFGEYVYDVQLTYQDGKKDTIIQPSKFIILSEVNDL